MRLEVLTPECSSLFISVFFIYLLISVFFNTFIYWYLCHFSSSITHTHRGKREGEGFSRFSARWKKTLPVLFQAAAEFSQWPSSPAVSLWLSSCSLEVGSTCYKTHPEALSDTKHFVSVYLVILHLCPWSSASGSFLFFFTGITEPLTGFTSWPTNRKNKNHTMSTYTHLHQPIFNHIFKAKTCRMMPVIPVYFLLPCPFKSKRF